MAAWRLLLGTNLLDDTPRHDICRLLVSLVWANILLLNLQTFACNVTFLLVLVLIKCLVKQVLLGIIIYGLSSRVLGILAVTLIHL